MLERASTASARVYRGTSSSPAPTAWQAARAACAAAGVEDSGLPAFRAALAALAASAMIEPKAAP